MKLRLAPLALSLGIFACCSAIAQAPSGAPAGTTGQCNDSTYTSATSKPGACRGHKGVKTWFGAAAAKPAPGTVAPASASVNSRPINAPPPAATPVPPTPVKPASTPAALPGGGPGLVWVNAETRVYHCQGDRFYGTTKNGRYMSEGDAQKMGAHPARGKSCSAH
jgi:hypothetical protein